MLGDGNSNSKKASGKRGKKAAGERIEEEMREDNTEEFTDLLRKGVPVNEILKRLGVDKRVAVAVVDDGNERFVFSARIVVRD